jgi:diazepam-binding inhibitor (GABA receptor modulating acyl-CoA-binding protein)
MELRLSDFLFPAVALLTFCALFAVGAVWLQANRALLDPQPAPPRKKVSNSDSTDAERAKTRREPAWWEAWIPCGTRVETPESEWTFESLLPGENSFPAAAIRAKSLPAHTSVREKLLLYGLYKQATVGEPPEAENPAPPFDVTAHEKWKAWASFRALSQEQAEAQYVDEVNRLMRTADPAARAAPSQSLL